MRLLGLVAGALSFIFATAGLTAVGTVFGCVGAAAGILALWRVNTLASDLKPFLEAQAKAIDDALGEATDGPG